MYITTIIFIITDVASIQDFSLNSYIFRKSLCWCLHRYQIFGHLDRWSRASGPWHFYLASHHFRWKPRSRFYSTNLCCCCLGRGHTPSGKYQSFAVYTVAVCDLHGYKRSSKHSTNILFQNLYIFEIILLFFRLALPLFFHRLWYGVRLMF